MSPDRPAEHGLPTLQATSSIRWSAWKGVPRASGRGGSGKQPWPRSVSRAYPRSSQAAADTSRGSAAGALKAATTDPSGLSKSRTSGSCCSR